MMFVNENFTHPSASDILDNKEIEEIINKFGSFFTMLTDRPISCVTYFLLLEKSPEIQTCIQTMVDVSWYELVDYMANRYSVLNKSKKIKNEHTLSPL